MSSKTVDENYRRLRAELDELLSKDKRLTAIADKISKGAADFSDTARYTQIVSKHMSDVIKHHIGELKLPMAKEMVCKELLRDHYELINGVFGEVQVSVDEKLGIHLNPIKPAYPAERVDSWAHSLEDPTVEPSVTERRAAGGSENIGNSMHDACIKENAKVREQAGLDCYLTRDAGGGCCPWCQALEGRFDYATAPDDIFRRHDNCTCTVTYECGRKRQDVWSKKTWEADPKDVETRIEASEAAKPVSLTKDQAEAINEQSKSNITVLSKEKAEAINEQNQPIVLTEAEAKEREAKALGKDDSVNNQSLDKSQKSGIIDIESRLKNIGFSNVDGSFFKNVNKDLRLSVTDQLEQLENKFNAISGSNKPVLSADLKGGTTACVKSDVNNPENQRMMLSSRDFKNRKKHISDRRKEVEEFFCMPCNIDDETLSRYVVTHEYGHMLENSIAAQDMKGTINTYSRLTQHYKEQIEKIARTIDADYDKNKSKYLSKYVRENTSRGKKDLEFFAECFANSQLGQPNVLGQAMLKWLEKRGFNVL